MGTIIKETNNLEPKFSFQKRIINNVLIVSLQVRPNINLISYVETSNINEKIVGRRYITIFKDGKPIEVLRKFNSSYTANLSTETKIGFKGKDETIRISKKNKIKKRAL